jgi:hypothetical protein
MGITSSTAAQANTSDPESRSVGYAENSALPLGPYTTFRGQAVDATSVLIAYTRTGDATLDGLVNDDDVTVVGATYAPATAQAHWALGDFDYNGFVADDDVTLLGVFYQPVAGAAAAPSVSIVAVSGGGFDTGVGGEHVTGQRTRTQPEATSAALDDALLELLATSIAETGDQNPNIADSRFAISRAKPADRFFWPL